MPLTKDITFKCPECGEEIPLTLWAVGEHR